MISIINSKSRFILAVLVTFTPALGCGKKKSDDGAKVNASIRSASSAALLLSEGGQDLVANGSANMGQASAANLKSLKYYISGISICKDMTLTGGTSFNNPTGCFSVYQPEVSQDPNYAYQPDTDYSHLGDVARGSANGFIDLMDPTSRAKLSTTTNITEDDAGDYNYGIITWYPVVKMTAEVPAGSSPSGYLRTADGVSSGSRGFGTDFTGDFSAVEVASEAVVVLGNGGNWFRFQKPLTITEDDVDNKAAFALDLTFNPDGLVKAYVAGYGDGCGVCTLKDTVANPVNPNSGSGNMFVPPPQISLIPIAHKADDKVMKEVYVASVEGSNSQGVDAFDLRVELYYLNSDASKSIYGAEVHTLINASSTSFVNDFSKISFIKTNDDGSVELQKHDAETVLSSLTRLSSVGEESTATIKCSALNNGGFTFKGCGSQAGDPDSMKVKLALKSVGALE